MLPIEAAISAAYDVAGGNHFRLWSEFGFAKARVANIRIKRAENEILAV